MSLGLEGCKQTPVHESRLVSMCRTEEFISFGDMVTLKKKNIAARNSSIPAETQTACN
jgi:hypothetical protein